MMPGKIGHAQPEPDPGVMCVVTQRSSPARLPASLTDGV
jgi:hypothetical protein